MAEKGWGWRVTGRRRKEEARSLKSIVACLCRSKDCALDPEISGGPRKGFRQKGEMMDVRKITWQETRLETRGVRRALQQFRKDVAQTLIKARV